MTVRVRMSRADASVGGTGVPGLDSFIPTPRVICSSAAPDAVARRARRWGQSEEVTEPEPVTGESHDRGQHRVEPVVHQPGLPPIGRLPEGDQQLGLGGGGGDERGTEAVLAADTRGTCGARFGREHVGAGERPRPARPIGPFGREVAGDIGLELVDDLGHHPGDQRIAGGEVVEDAALAEAGLRRGRLQGEVSDTVAQDNLLGCVQDAALGVGAVPVGAPGRRVSPGRGGGHLRTIPSRRYSRAA